MGTDPPPPTVEYATPARETRRGSRMIVSLMLVALVVLAAAAGLLLYLLVGRSTVTVQVAPAPLAPVAPVTAKPPSLSLPSDPLRLTLRQRETRALPGSKDTVLLNIGDITRGQMLLDVSGADGTPIVDTTSVRQGDSVTFSLKGGGPYVIDVVELHNSLTSGDFAVLSIATPGKRPTTKPTTTTAPAR